MATRSTSRASSKFATALNTPLPAYDHDCSPPASFLGHDAPSPPVSYTLVPTVNNSVPLLQIVEKEELESHGSESAASRAKKRLLFRWLPYIAAAIVVILVVMLPIYFAVLKSSPKESGTGPTGSGSLVGNTTSGGNGSLIVADNEIFVYNNTFGGYWVYDPSDPFNNNARPNSWTPPLNTSWTWGTDHVYGVNLAGLFVLEPYISPALFQKYPGAVDEWTLSQLMAADTASGGLSQIEDHYNTFITERDIAQIAGAGLNWIRLPIPFWAIETWPGEPFLAKTSWKYILRMLGWARKYGLRVHLDLYTAPGSQNGFNQSGKLGQINFLNGVMGIANAQRTLNYIRIIAEFISQPEYRDVVLAFGILNEPMVANIGRDQMSSFYYQAYSMIREITGIGEGKGPFVSIHDGFVGLPTWGGFLRGSDRIMLDTHPYLAFNHTLWSSPIATGTGLNVGGDWPSSACLVWAPGMNTSQTEFGVTVAGEFTAAVNDCGLFVNGVNTTSSADDCSLWVDSLTWNTTLKAGVQRYVLANMDALQNFFFLNWKVGPSVVTGTVQAPLWSYQLGLENGWMPTDPRQANGICASLGVSTPAFGGEYESWQTGGPGAGTVVPSAIASFGLWPPATISGVSGNGSVASLPTYTPTGTVVTLPPLTFTAMTTKSISVGNGWFDPQDTSGAPTPIAGCTYLNAWDAVSAAVPTAYCGSTTSTALAVTAAP